MARQKALRAPLTTLAAAISEGAAIPLRAGAMTQREATPPALSLFIPGPLHSRLNGSGSRAHWSTISAERRRRVDQVAVAYLLAGSPRWDGPARVTFTAYVGRYWDDDNLPAALKTVRDASVRLILGTDDGPMCGHTFAYRQALRPKAARGVLITVTAR